MENNKKTELKKIDFGFIAPFSYLNKVPEDATFHLILAHLLKYPQYVEFYNKKYERGDYILLDNSAFEFKRPIEADEMLKMIKDSGIKFNCLVAPDYPFCEGKKTIDSARKFIERLKQLNIKCDVMAVPQSKDGDSEDWIKTYKELSLMDGVTHIGMSILGIPNAFHKITGTKDIMINRLHVANYLVNERLNYEELNIKHHFLGLGQPRELLLQRQIGLIDSNDSSSPIWHGHLGIRYDDSFGGLINGKNPTPVDFVNDHIASLSNINDIDFNIEMINRMCKG